MSNHDQGSRETTHAIVIGAGIAGLVTARVLTHHFDRVTLLDRDELPEGPEVRGGVPQARQLHLLFVAGSRIVEKLFPGVDAELAEAGAPALDFGWDALLLLPHGKPPRIRSGLVINFCSRGLREWAIRRRLEQMPQVRVLGGCEVAGLLGDKNGVSGVRLRPRGRRDQEKPRSEGLPDTLRADFIVDTSGRESRNLQWLADLGFPAPKESFVSSFVGYSSRLYRPTRELEWKLMADTPSAPGRPRGAVIALIEGNTWLVTLLGAARNYPPTSDPDFVEWTRDLRTPLIYKALQGAEPLSPAYSYRRTENRFRHFEQMPRWPERFVALGDAVACFNPIYGQGMTVSAQSAMALDKSLREHREKRSGRGGDLTGFAPAFQKRLARRLITPWVLATSEDFRWPSTEGEQPSPLLKLAQKYVDQLLQVAMNDEETYATFLGVQHGIRPAQALLHPAIAAKMARRVFNR